MKRSAQRVIEKACPDERVRKIALSILADAIEEANVYGRDKWAVRVKETARLGCLASYQTIVLRFYLQGQIPWPTDEPKLARSSFARDAQIYAALSGG
jgi:hypothetical protein